MARDAQWIKCLCTRVNRVARRLALLSAQLLNYSFNRIVMAKSEIWCITFGHDNLISSFKFMFHSFFTQTNQPTNNNHTFLYISNIQSHVEETTHVISSHFYQKRKQTSSTNSQNKTTCVHLCHTKYFTTSQSIQTHFTFISTFSKTISKFQQTRLYVCALVVIYCSQQNLCTKFGIKTCVA